MHVSEDVERNPDGVPHVVVGLTIVFGVVFAILLAFLFVTRSTISALIAGLIGLPVLVMNLTARAERARDHVHLSR